MYVAPETPEHPPQQGSTGSGERRRHSSGECTGEPEGELEFFLAGLPAGFDYGELDFLARTARCTSFLWEGECPS